MKWTTVGNPMLKLKCNKNSDYKVRISSVEMFWDLSILVNIYTLGMAISSYLAAKNKHEVALAELLYFRNSGANAILWYMLNAKNIVYTLNPYLRQKSRISCKKLIRSLCVKSAWYSNAGIGKSAYCLRRCSPILEK